MFGGVKSVWQTAGMTLSAKAACAEYGITEDDMKAANIPCQWRSFHGNSYAVVIRSDVERLAREKRGPLFEVDETRKALRAVNAELATVDAKRASLAERKASLEGKLTSLGAPLEEPPKPKAAGKGGRKKAAPAAAAAGPAPKKGRKRGSSGGAVSDEEWKP